MSASNHGRSIAARAAYAAGGIAVFIGLAEAAHVVNILAGPSGLVAGVALVVAVFAACWYVWRVRPMLHPVPPARRSGTRGTEVTAEPPALAGTAASR